MADVYGNTAVYLVRDCGIWTAADPTGQTLLRWASYAVEVDLQQTDPPAGDGYYYVVSGTCAQPIGYGNSSAGARTELPGLPPVASCP